MRPPLRDLADMEDQGMFASSPAGESFVCRCNWRSGIKSEPENLALAIENHWWKVHARAGGATPTRAGSDQSE